MPKKRAKNGDKNPDNGQFTRGNGAASGKGRPKKDTLLKDRCKNLTDKAVGLLEKIMVDVEARGTDRIRAAEIILAYGHGKPTQRIAGDTELPPVRVWGANGVEHLGDVVGILHELDLEPPGEEEATPS